MIKKYTAHEIAVNFNIQFGAYGTESYILATDLSEIYKLAEEAIAFEIQDQYARDPGEGAKVASRIVAEIKAKVEGGQG